MAIKNEVRNFTDSEGEAHSVSSYQFQISEALEVWKILADAIGPSMATAFASLKGDGDGLLDANVDAVVLGDAVRQLLASQTPKGLVELSQRLLKTSKIDGKEIVFEINFSGEMLMLFEVLAFVLELNYKDFFVGLMRKAQASELATKMATAKLSASDSSD